MSLLTRVEQPVAAPVCLHRARAGGVCLDCADGLDAATETQQHEALSALAAWLAEAGPVATELSRTPADPRYVVAVSKLARRGAAYRAVLGALTALNAGAGLRFGFDVRWTRAKGILEVRDCETGGWLVVNAPDVPRAWVRRATIDANAEREQRRGALA